MTTRRALLASVAGALAGGGLVTAASGDARAAVTLGELSVGDGTESVRGDVQRVMLAVEAGYQFEVPDYQSAPELWQVRVVVGETVIATADGRASARSESGTVSLSGSVLDAGFSAVDFAPPATVDVPVRVEMEVLAGRETVAAASVSRTVSVDVTEAEYDADAHGGVGGRVEIGITGAQ